MESINKSRLEKIEEEKFMNLPEIIVREEKGLHLLSILFKIIDSNWGNNQTDLSRKINDYFSKQNIFDQETLLKIKNFYNNIDEETLYNIAFTYNHPERNKKIFEVLLKNKPNIKNLSEIHSEILKILSDLDRIFSSSPLYQEFQLEVNSDINKRLEQISETRKRIYNIISFFKPYSKTTTIKKIIFVATDPLYPINSGKAFFIPPDKYIISSNISNIDNQDHEFEHCIINPIVEKLMEKLTDEQKQKIINFASEKLKIDYDENCFSLLCEEFIRTYNNFIKQNREILSYENFLKRISNITNEQFQKFLEENELFKQRCLSLGIRTIEEFKNKSKEYYDKFERNQLRDLIFKLYQDYINRSDKNQNFEEFILKNFLKMI